MKYVYSTKQKVTLWILQIVAAVILLQTLFFKLTGAEESIMVFSALGMEPYGRIAIAILELIAGLLLLSWRFSASGAVLSIGLMVGAVIAHISVLGINDLFYLAVVVMVSSAIVAWVRKKEIPLIGGTL